MWMWSFARAELGLGTAEFYRLTLRQFAALRQRHDQRVRQQAEMTELMGAQIVAMIANTGFRSFKELRVPNEFMPSAWASKPGRPKRGPTRQDKARAMKKTLLAYMA